WLAFTVFWWAVVGYQLVIQWPATNPFAKYAPKIRSDDLTMRKPKWAGRPVPEPDCAAVLGKFGERGPIKIGDVGDEEAFFLMEAKKQEDQHGTAINRHLLEMGKSAVVPPAILFLFGWTMLWIGRGFRSERRR